MDFEKQWQQPRPPRPRRSIPWRTIGLVTGGVLVVIIVVLLARSCFGKSSSTKCFAHDPPRLGWLVDYDRRGEVALRQQVGPAANIMAVVALDEFYPVQVDRECVWDGILYYHVDAGSNRIGWVDVDYLQWEKPFP